MTGVYVDEDGSTITAGSTIRAGVRFGFTYHRPDRSETAVLRCALRRTWPQYRVVPRTVRRAFCWGVLRGHAMAREGWWLNDAGEWCC